MTDTIITIMTHTVITDSRTDEAVPRQPPFPPNVTATRLRRVTVWGKMFLFLNVDYMLQPNHSGEGFSAVTCG